MVHGDTIYDKVNYILFYTGSVYLIALKKGYEKPHKRLTNRQNSKKKHQKRISASKKKLQLKTSFMKIIWIPFYGFLVKVAPPHYPMQSKICSHLLPLLVTYEMTGFALTYLPQMGLLPLKLAHRRRLLLA